jgi:hypothetical protein
MSVICEDRLFFLFYGGVERFLFSGVSDAGGLNLAVGKRAVLPEGE